MTRAEVVERAIGCIAAEGAKVLGVNRVARELNIKPPSLYNHVRGNDDLRQAVAIEGWRRLGRAMADAPADPGGSAIRHVCVAFRDWVVANQALYQVMSNTSLDPESAEFAPVNDANMGFMVSFVAGRSDEEAIHALRTIRAALHGFVLLEAGGQFRLGVDTSASFEWLVKALEQVAETG